ncbi:MAG: hypothetical protein QXU45_03435 [Candidatus Bathyarchaeia archaeon]
MAKGLGKKISAIILTRNQKGKCCMPPLFGNFGKEKKGIMGKEWRHGKLYELNRQFRKAFNALCRERKKEQKPITWKDIAKFELNP